MIPNEAMFKAIEGGWKVPHVETPDELPAALRFYGHGTEWRKIALDSSFWQGLGNALGWRKKVDVYELGKKIKRLRTARGLHQAELGKELGYSAMGISHFENGQRNLNMVTVEKLARFFQEEPYKFLTWTDESITNAHRFYDLILTGNDTTKFWHVLLEPHPRPDQEAK